MRPTSKHSTTKTIIFPPTSLKLLKSASRCPRGLENATGPAARTRRANIQRTIRAVLQVQYYGGGDAGLAAASMEHSYKHKMNAFLLAVADAKQARSQRNQESPVTPPQSPKNRVQQRLQACQITTPLPIFSLAA